VLGVACWAGCGDDTDTTPGGGGSGATATGSAGAGGSSTGAGGTGGTSTGSGGTAGAGGNASGGGGGGPSTMQQGFATVIGAGAWERVQTVWADASGDIYVCGSTKSASFPTTGGVYDTTFGGGGQNDGWVAKLSADGTQLLWSTYLGGSDRDDCYGIMTDSSGNVYVTGWTRSSDFPTTVGAYDRSHGGLMDIFLAKLNPTGTQLLYSTFVGGSGTDQCRGAMAIDTAGVLYFAGYTDSPNYPTTAGAIQSSYQGGYGDAVVGRLSADGSALDYSTYLGTSGPDTAFSGVRLNGDGSLSVVGLAGGTGFPTTGGVLQATYAGDSGGSPWYGDAFASRMTIGVGTATMHFATYLGGSGNDMPLGQHAMAGDATGVYVYLTTDSNDLTTTAGAYQTSLAGTDNLYVAKVSYDGTALVSATYLGGSGVSGYEPSGFKVSASGRLLLGGSIFGSTTGHPTTSDAAQPNAGSADEGFFLILDNDMTALRYSTFVGGSGNDRVRDVALRSGESAVVVGDTFSSDFPTTTGAYDESHNGDDDGHVASYDAVP
jgi:hypothetical protein